jgi:hypothetical protein
MDMLQFYDRVIGNKYIRQLHERENVSVLAIPCFISEIIELSSIKLDTGRSAPEFVVACLFIYLFLYLYRHNIIST